MLGRSICWAYCFFQIEDLNQPSLGKETRKLLLSLRSLLFFLITTFRLHKKYAHLLETRKRYKDTRKGDHAVFFVLLKCYYRFLKAASKNNSLYTFFVEYIIWLIVYIFIIFIKTIWGY